MKHKHSKSSKTSFYTNPFKPLTYITTYTVFFTLPVVATAAMPPIIITAPAYPISVSTGATATVTYNLKSNIPITVYPTLLASETTTTAGSIVQAGGSCSAGVTQGSTCTIELTYTAPVTAPAGNTATAAIFFGYGGRDNLLQQTGTFTIGGSSLPSVTNLSPATGSVMGGQTVTITGQNLAALLAKSSVMLQAAKQDANATKTTLGATPAVTFDGQSATVTASSATSITVTTPDDSAKYVAPGDSPPSGGAVQPGSSSDSMGGSGYAVDVVVTTGAGSATDIGGYTYVGLGDNYDGGIIYALDSTTGTPATGNPSGKVVSTTDFGPNISWNNTHTSGSSPYGANSYCANYTSVDTQTNWGLPDPTAFNGAPIISGPVTGDFVNLYNSGSPYGGMLTSYAYWGTDTDAGSDAWLAYFSSGTEGLASKSIADNDIYARCVRTFTS